MLSEIRGIESKRSQYYALLNVTLIITIVSFDYALSVSLPCIHIAIMMGTYEMLHNRNLAVDIIRQEKIQLLKRRRFLQKRSKSAQ